jgi:predicted dehydrogenase
MDRSIMASRTRWGILATGRIAASFVADLKLLPDTEVAAVGSRRSETAEAFAREHGIPRAYGSWAELAADPEVDVVYVATPHSAHFAATMECLRAGKPVRCEKPFTLDHASARELIDEAHRRGLFLMEAIWTRTLPAVRRIQELVAEGAIGEVTAVYADFSIAGPFPPTHWLRAKAMGGGALLDLGVYPITFAHLFLGVPERITALATLSREGVDENTGMVFGYPDGGIATLHCGIIGAGQASATIIGTTGRIVLPKDFFRPSSFILVRGQHAEQVTVPMRGNGMGYEAEEVADCLAGGRTHSKLVPLTATLEMMRILDEVRAQIGVAYSP